MIRSEFTGPPAFWPPVKESIFAQIQREVQLPGSVDLAFGGPLLEDEPPLAMRGNLQTSHHQYAPPAGLSDLRHAVAHASAQHDGLTWNPDSEVTIVNGATEGIFLALNALLRQGDEVVIPAPYFEAYAAVANGCGAVVREVPMLFEKGRFSFDWPAISSAINDRSRALILNTPHNPTGAVITQADLEQLSSVIAPWPRLTVIADEAYDHVLMLGRRHLSVASQPALRERVCVLSSISKTQAATGWRIGWVLAPTELTASVRQVKQFLNYCSPTPLQATIAAMMSDGSYHERALRIAARFRERVEFVSAWMRDLGLQVALTDGTYFVAVRGLWPADRDGVSGANALFGRHGVRVLPMQWFALHGDQWSAWARVACCKPWSVLREAAHRLQQAAQAGDLRRT